MDWLDYQIFSMVSSVWLMCLCVDNPDVVNVIGQSLSRKQLDKPVYKHVKRTNVFTPPSQSHYYEIGLKLGILTPAVKSVQLNLGDFSYAA